MALLADKNSRLQVTTISIAFHLIEQSLQLIYVTSIMNKGSKNENKQNRIE